MRKYASSLSALVGLLYLTVGFASWGHESLVSLAAGGVSLGHCASCRSLRKEESRGFKEKPEDSERSRKPASTGHDPSRCPFCVFLSTVGKKVLFPTCASQVICLWETVRLGPGPSHTVPRTTPQHWSFFPRAPPSPA
jgi:hypothetical protein